MNERKLKQLFGAARKETPPAPPEDFAQRVMQAVRRDAATPPAEVTLFDQLNQLFPRIAWAAAVVLVLCVAGELVSSATQPSFNDVAQLSDQWFGPEEF